MAITSAKVIKIKKQLREVLEKNGVDVAEIRTTISTEPFPEYIRIEAILTEKKIVNKGAN